jgi:ketosteroid isomerase-like protein
MNAIQKRLVGAMCLLAGLTVPCSARAQRPIPAAEKEALTQTVSALDTELFDAYNHCDLKTLGAMVADDLEFYHDQTGLMVGKAPFLAAIQQNICGKVERTLVLGSLEVYPLKGYGAVEIGVHRFHKPGHPEDLGGEAKFVQLWQNKDGVWRVTRVISYNHESLTK